MLNLSSAAASDASDVDLSDDSSDIDILERRMPKEEPAKYKRALENDDNFTPVKKVKSFSVPSFIKKESVEVFKRTAELQQQHKEQDEKTMMIIKKDDEVRRKIIGSLDKEAAKDTEYVNFVIRNHKHLRLEDLFLCGQPKFIQLNETVDPNLLELCAIHSNVKLHGDFFNTLNYSLLKKMEFQYDGDVADFAAHFGFESETLKKAIIERELRFDPCTKLQEVTMILLRLRRYCDYTTAQRFNAQKWRTLMKLLGLLMMEKRVSSQGSSLTLTQLVQKLLQWGHTHTKRIMIAETIDIWSSSTDLTFLKYRIVEKLHIQHSEAIRQLKMFFVISIITDGEFKELEYVRQDKMKGLVNQAILDMLIKLTNTPDISKYTTEDSQEAHNFFEQLRLKIQCVVYIVSPSNEEGLAGFKDLTIKKITQKLKDLERKITISYDKASQTQVKTVLTMLITRLGGTS